MSFSENAAWTLWCVTRPFDCIQFENDANVALAAIKAGNLQPARKFIEDWQQVADMNEAAGAAIQTTLDQMRAALANALLAVTEPISEGLKPIAWIVGLGIVGLVAWKL